MFFKMASDCALVTCFLSRLFLGEFGVDMHFLATAHTGFKVAWLFVLLNQNGHTVSGVSRFHSF